MHGIGGRADDDGTGWCAIESESRAVIEIRPRSARVVQGQPRPPVVRAFRQLAHGDRDRRGLPRQQWHALTGRKAIVRSGERLELDLRHNARAASVRCTDRQHYGFGIRPVARLQLAASCFAFGQIDRREKHWRWHGRRGGSRSSGGRRRGRYLEAASRAGSRGGLESGHRAAPCGLCSRQ